MSLSTPTQKKKNFFEWGQVSTALTNNGESLGIRERGRDRVQIRLVSSCEVVEERITDTDTEGVRSSRPPEKSTRAYPLGLITYKEG